MFYECSSCSKKFRFEIGDINDKEFGKCPICKTNALFVSDSSKNEIKDVNNYEEIVL